MSKSKFDYNLGLVGIFEAATKGGSIGLANENAFNNSTLSVPLTGFVVGWLTSQQALIDLLEFLAPQVPTTRKFEYKVRNTKNAFIVTENDQDIRSLYGEFARFQSTGTTQMAKTLSKGLSKLLERDEIAEDPMAKESAVAEITSALLRAEILRAFAILHLISVKTGKTWSTGADADIDLMKAISAGGDTVGINPNRLIFGQTAWQNRVMGLRILDNAGGYASAGLTAEQLAAFLAVESVKVANERYETGSGKAQLISNDVVLAFNATSGATKDDPSNIKRFTSSAGFKVFERDVSSELVEITVSHHSHIIATSSQGVREIKIS